MNGFDAPSADDPGETRGHLEGPKESIPVSAHRPPLLPRLWARAVLPASIQDAVLGDLEERFHREAAEDPRRARRNFRRDAFSPGLHGLRREVRGMPLPPGARPRTATGDGLVNSLAQDAKFALRMMAKAPAFTAVAVLSLALGIGPNTATFSLVDSLLLTEWGVEDPSRVMDIYSMTRDGEFFYTYHGVWELLDEGAEEAFTAVTASAQYPANLQLDGRSELVMGEMVKGNYFTVHGIEAQLGRTFLPEEDATPGTHPVVVISDRYWRTRHDRDPDMIGSEIRLNGRPYTVVGIAPEEFKGRVAPGLGTDFWVPLSMYPHLAPNQMGNGNLLVTGRLRPGVTPEQATAQVDAVAARFNEARPESRSTLELGSVILDDVVLNPNFDGFLLGLVALLFGAVGLVLLVACVNLAGFLLSRATERRKEMAVRVAMGAGKRDIVRQLLVESLMLATLGGALGVVLGLTVSRILAGIEAPLDLPLDFEVGLNLRVLLFTGAVTILAAVLFGLAPALEATRSPVAATLRDETGADSGRGKKRVRGILVAAQMALSTVLLVGAGLFLRSLQEARSIDPGFDTGPAAVVQVQAWASDLDPDEEKAYAEALLREVEALPGVVASGATTRMPLDLGTTTTSFDIPGVEPPPDQNRHVLELAYTTDGYFDVMGIGLLDGRLFEAGDRDDSRLVGLVSRAAAELYWPGESALGRELHRGGDPEDAITVVGVVDDTKIWSLTEPPRPYLYLSARQIEGYGGYHVVARGNEDPLVLAERIREVAAELNPRVFVSTVETMDDHLSYVLFLPRMAATLLLAIGLLAVALACVGLYGMVSYSVTRRTREVGIRLALGAERREVVGMVVKSGLALVVVGGVVGLGLAVVAGSALERYLVQVDSLDPIALTAVPLLLFTIAGLAAWLPARRAARVNPMDALRVD